MIDQTLSQALQKEIPILTAQIRSLYAEFDKKFHLNGAKIPITFGMEPDLLGSYTRGSCHEKEHFHFSLLFIGYAVKNPLKKEDIEEFLRFAEKEGYADETMQIKSIELSRQGLEHTADMQQREITQKCRLSVGLGAMSGLLILLLLV